MNVLFLTHIYPPEPVPMFAEATCFFKKHGWQVRVVTGHPSYQMEEAYGPMPVRPWVREERDGVEVCRAWHWRAKSSAFVSSKVLLRGIQHVSQTVGMATAAMFGQTPDIVLVCGPPLVGTSAAWVVARRYGAKLVNLLLDLYPDIAVETGYVRHPVVVGGARALERFQYWAADMVIVPSDDIRKRLLSRGVPEKKINVIPAWFNAQEVWPAEKGEQWRAINGVPADKKLVMYSGTIGLVSNAHIITDVAERLRHREDILFAIIGNGGLKDELENRARSLRLANIRFWSRRPRGELNCQLAAADICLVTMGPGRGYTSFPSKMLAYMAAGKPVVASLDLDCEAAGEIKKYRFGRVSAPGDAEGLVAAILALADEEDRRIAFGRAARQRLVERFDSDVVLAQLENVLRSFVECN